MLRTHYVREAKSHCGVSSLAVGTVYPEVLLAFGNHVLTATPGQDAWELKVYELATHQHQQLASFANVGGVWGVVGSQDGLSEADLQRLHSEVYDMLQAERYEDGLLVALAPGVWRSSVPIDMVFEHVGGGHAKAENGSGTGSAAG